MSCRRADITNLRGCRIGDIALRGCGRGCCPYPDDQISFNIRHHYKHKEFPGHYERTTPHPIGRERLYYDLCQCSYRPKFICAKKSCRRSVKPVYDPNRNEYQISKTQGWTVRPLKGTNEAYDEACRNGMRISNLPRDVKNLPDSEFQKRQFLIQKLGRAIAWEMYGNYYGDGENGAEMEDDEMEYLKNNDSATWWLELIRLPTVSASGVNMKRCPGCGEGVLRVGSNFRIPARADNKAWKKVEEMIDRGDDMVASFSTCTTIEQHKEMTDEALRLKSRIDGANLWEAEKRRRIEAA